jgi:hypothetical protein
MHVAIRFLLLFSLVLTIASAQCGFVLISCGQLGGPCGTVVANYSGQQTGFIPYYLGDCYPSICLTGLGRGWEWEIWLDCDDQEYYYNHSACC